MHFVVMSLAQQVVMAINRQGGWDWENWKQKPVMHNFLMTDEGHVCDVIIPGYLVRWTSVLAKCFI